MDEDKNFNKNICPKATIKISTNYNLVLEVYYNFAYYLCCVPYRFKINRANNEVGIRKKVYIIHTWWIQKVCNQ